MVPFRTWRDRFQTLISRAESLPTLDPTTRISTRSALFGQANQLLDDLKAAGSMPVPRGDRVAQLAGEVQVVRDGIAALHGARLLVDLSTYSLGVGKALLALMHCLGSIYSLDLLCLGCHAALGGELPASGEAYCATCWPSLRETLARRRLIAFYSEAASRGAEAGMAGFFDDFPSDAITLIKADGARVETTAIVSTKGRTTTMMVSDERFPVEAGDTIERRVPSGIVERYEVEDPGFNSGLGGAAGIPAHYNIRVRNLGARARAPQGVVHQHTYNNTGQVGAMGPNAVASHNVLQQVQPLPAADLAKLATELTQLRKALAKRVAEADDDSDASEDAIEVGHVSEAEKAAKAGDQAGLFGALRRLARKTWALAEQLGLEFLKLKGGEVLGLPDGDDK